MNEHDILWAPWRLEFVQLDDAEKEIRKAESRVDVGPDCDPDCFICQAVADSRDRERHVFFRSERSVGILNRYPYNNGHLLLAPRRHIAKLGELTEEEMLDLTRQIARWVERLEREMRPDGFNVGLNLGHAAGAGLPGHLHWHIVPRWSGDTNFMTAVGGAKVIPQSLDALWEILVGGR